MTAGFVVKGTMGMNSEIEMRIRKYLERDKNGIRRELIRILLEGRKFTTEEIHRKLVERGFNINVRGVSAMVGLIGARLGILKTELGEKNRYYLRKEYGDLVKRVLQEFES
jgi:arginine repressor